MRAKGNRLTVNFAHTPDHQFDFKPVDTDVFQFARINIRFIRNTKGNITSLRFTNPVVRNIDFYRVEP